MYAMNNTKTTDLTTSTFGINLVNSLKLDRTTPAPKVKDMSPKYSVVSKPVESPKPEEKLPQIALAIDNSQLLSLLLQSPTAGLEKPQLGI